MTITPAAVDGAAATAAAVDGAAATAVTVDSAAATAAENEDLQLAAAYLSRVAEPAAVALFDLVSRLGYLHAASAVRSGDVDDAVAACTQARRSSVDAAADLDAAARHNIRVLTPASPEWPHFALSPLYQTAAARLSSWRAGRRHESARGELIPPLALWVKGAADLSTVGPRALAVVGSRASTAYGDHVAADWCYRLAMHEVVIVSGGAYGIDAAAHRGALAAEGVSVLVSAGGLDRPYPSGNAALYDRISDRGLLVSERPPGSAPHRQRFLSRNRLIACLGAATLVVEAAQRSGALNSAGYARDLGRPVLAVPGPVTSALSQGCHALLRRDEEPARLVGRVEEVLDYCGPAAVSALGDAAPESVAADGGAAQPALFALPDSLTPLERSVLDGFPARGWITEAQLSQLCGHPVPVVIAALPTLTELNLISSSRQGYRLSR